MICITSRIAVPAVITSSMISTWPLSGAPTSVPPSPWSFGFLAVEAPGQVALVLLGEGHRGGGGQGMPFVGRAEQDVEVDSAVDHRLGVEASQAGQRQAAVEQAGIEEIGAGAPGLEGELTEAQNPALDGETNEIALDTPA